MSNARKIFEALRESSLEDKYGVDFFKLTFKKGDQYFAISSDNKVIEVSEHDFYTITGGDEVEDYTPEYPKELDGKKLKFRKSDGAVALPKDAFWRYRDLLKPYETLAVAYKPYAGPDHEWCVIVPDTSNARFLDKNKEVNIKGYRQFNQDEIKTLSLPFDKISCDNDVDSAVVSIDVDDDGVFAYCGGLEEFRDEYTVTYNGKEYDLIEDAIKAFFKDKGFDVKLVDTSYDPYSPEWHVLVKED